jgi:hypothetical protein
MEINSSANTKVETRKKRGRVEPEQRTRGQQNQQ